VNSDTKVEQAKLSKNMPYIQSLEMKYIYIISTIAIFSIEVSDQIGNSKLAGLYKSCSK
jgi:uncharacterized membrane protein (DUF441 family)